VRRLLPLVERLAYGRKMLSPAREDLVQIEPR